ncbi:MAG TPA: hypothetical protein DGR79_02440 [Clostridiales bacterium]|nr:hypothetical protein [Clostridiales bacterium]
MIALYFVAALLVMLLVVAVFASQNVHLVDVNLLVWRFSWPLGVIVLAATAAGAVVVALLGLVRQVGLSLRIHDARGRLRKAETQLESARGELDKAKAALSRKEEELSAARDEIAALKEQLEELRKRAAPEEPVAAGAAEGGPPHGPGARRG